MKGASSSVETFCRHEEWKRKSVYAITDWSLSPPAQVYDQMSRVTLLSSYYIRLEEANGKWHWQGYLQWKEPVCVRCMLTLLKSRWPKACFKYKQFNITARQAFLDYCTKKEGKPDEKKKNWDEFPMFGMDNKSILASINLQDDYIKFVDRLNKLRTETKKNRQNSPKKIEISIGGQLFLKK